MRISYAFISDALRAVGNEELKWENMRLRSLCQNIRFKRVHIYDDRLRLRNHGNHDVTKLSTITHIARVYVLILLINHN